MNIRYISVFVYFPLISLVSLNAMLPEVKKSEKCDYFALPRIAEGIYSEKKEFSYFSVTPDKFFASLSKRPSNSSTKRENELLTSEEKHLALLFFSLDQTSKLYERKPLFFNTEKK